MSLSDYPINTRSINWKYTAIGVAGFVIVLIIVFVVLRIVGGSESPSTVTPTVVNQTQSNETCELLKEVDERDNCYWVTANENFDMTFCAAISDIKLVGSCSDGIAQELAFKNYDAVYCDRIANEGRAARCKAILSGPITSANCEERAPGSCGDIILYEQAVASKDRSICAQIQNEGRRMGCYEMVEEYEEESAEADSDSDGLTDAEEELYGTDPENPDTDADGYPDGSEVLKGYNPLGSGKM